MTDYTVNTSTILGENYKIISIEATNYNPVIDSDVSITVTVLDVDALFRFSVATKVPE